MFGTPVASQVVERDSSLQCPLHYCQRGGVTERRSAPGGLQVRSPLDAAASAAATRGSARNSVAAKALPCPCALSRGVLPPCSKRKGSWGIRKSGTGRAAAVHASHPIFKERVYPRGCEEENDDVIVASESRRVKRGHAKLQW